MHDDQSSEIIRRRGTHARAHPELIVGELAIPSARSLAWRPVGPGNSRPARRISRVFAAVSVAIVIVVMLRYPASRPDASPKGLLQIGQHSETLLDHGPWQMMPSSLTNSGLLDDPSARMRKTRRACLRGLQQACAEYRAGIRGLQIARIPMLADRD